MGVAGRVARRQIWQKRRPTHIGETPRSMVINPFSICSTMLIAFLQYAQSYAMFLLLLFGSSGYTILCNIFLMQIVFRLGLHVVTIVLIVPSLSS